MSRPESKSPSIAFDSDSSSDSSDDETAISPALLAPTPTLSERLKKANEDLLSHPSPPNSRASRIGFRDETNVLEYNEESEPKSVEDIPKSISPLVREHNIIVPPEHDYPDDFEEEHQNEKTPEEPQAPPEQPEESLRTGDADPEPIEEPVPEPTSPLSPDSVLVEENGQFHLSDVGESEMGQTNYSTSSGRNDVNPDYKSPYALTDAQKNMGRQRQAAKMRRLKAEEELKRVELEEQKEENESSYQAWLSRKHDENKSTKKSNKKVNLNSSKMIADQPTAEERDEIWQEWLSHKDKQHRQQRIIEHQMEIEKMEGLYVRSRQENDKAFRRWKKNKVREAREAQRVHWEQVQISKSELRQIRHNQKQATILNAARVASALEFF